MLAIKNKLKKVFNSLKFSLKAKLLFIAIVPLVITSIVALKVVQQSNTLTSDLKYVVENTISAVTLSKEMVGDVKILKKAIHYMTSEEISSTAYDNNFIEIEDAIRRIRLSISLYGKILMPEKADVLRKKIYELWEGLDVGLPKIIEFLDSEDKNGAKAFYSKEIESDLNNFLATLSNIELNNADIIELEKNKIAGIKTISNKLSLAIAIGFSLIIFIMIYLMVTKLTKSLNESVEIIRKTVESSENSAVKVLGVTQSVKKVFEKISEAISDTTSVAQQIKNLSENNASEITSSSELSNKNLSGVNESVQKSKEINEMFNSVKSASQNVGLVIENNNKNISEILELMEEINAKISMINDVVFQTKLLSFNASVEAARAGEAGKGFSVVAEEVSSLAIQSGKAALEIFNILDKSKKQVEEIVQESKQESSVAISKTSTYIESSIKLVDDINSVFNTLMTNIKESNSITDRITKSSNEQFIGLGKLDESFLEINKVSAESSNEIDELENVSKEISTQASESYSAVDRLIKLIN